MDLLHFRICGAASFLVRGLREMLFFYNSALTFWGCWVAGIELRRLRFGRYISLRPIHLLPSTV